MDNETQDKLEGIPEEPIETTATSDTPQPETIQTKDGDPHSQEEDDSKEEESKDTPCLGEESQSTKEDDKSIGESSESKSDESTSTPEESPANDSTEPGMEPFTIMECRVSSSRVHE